LSDDEVEYKNEKGKLYWIKYGPFTLATARPETKLGDTAVAVHPDDKRYKDMVGKKYMIPGALGEFEITVVADKAVDMEFGSGAIKVTPGHSVTDFEISKRHNLPVKKIIDEKGQMMANCGKYKGMTTLECREAIVKDMEKMGLIEKIEDYDHNLSVCYRCGHTIEPLVSDQWFIDVNKKIKKLGDKSLKEKSLEVVKNGDIKIIPDRFEKIYYHWIENLHDWCISRQIWFGHRMPVYYKKDDKQKKDPIVSMENLGEQYIQEQDTLDTWFSSGLWTFSTLGYPEKTKDLKNYHPTDVMETGYDILFFWVARMILMTTYAMDEVPFKTVYLHGLVRTRDGSKMSKSKPATIIDPLDMIKEFGTDSLRLSLLIGTSPGNDIKLYKEKIAGYRNFVNKLWNVSRYILTSHDIPKNYKKPKPETVSDKAILTLFDEIIEKTTKDIDNFQFGAAGDRLYDFLWHEFADWYLEISKFEKTDSKPEILYYILTNLLKLLHPMVPFVTEEIWKNLNQPEMLMITTWPKPKKYNFTDEVKKYKLLKGIIIEINSLRGLHKIEPCKIIEFKNRIPLDNDEIKIIENRARVKFIKTLPDKGVVSTFAVDLLLGDIIDLAKEKLKLDKNKKELEKYIIQLEKKLGNKKYRENASEEIQEQDELRHKQKKKELKYLQEYIREFK
ncbi:MAG: valine--tRNA ligase, partial [Patescibacteria group bacterium]